jgi:hypothetical protein
MSYSLRIVKRLRRSTKRSELNSSATRIHHAASIMPTFVTDASLRFIEVGKDRHLLP